MNDYVYRVRETGEIVVVQMTWQERNRRESNGFITLPDGREARFSPVEQICHEQGKPPAKPGVIRTRAKWPLRTSLTGVGEHQVDELRAFLAERGVRGTTVHDDGSVEWESRKARKDYCRATGLYDRNAGYGDPAPVNL